MFVWKITFNCLFKWSVRRTYTQMKSAWIRKILSVPRFFIKKKEVFRDNIPACDFMSIAYYFNTSNHCVTPTEYRLVHLEVYVGHEQSISGTFSYYFLYMYYLHLLSNIIIFNLV